MSDTETRTVVVNLPVSVTVTLSFDADGQGEIVSVDRIDPSDACASDIYEALDHEERLSELDRSVDDAEIAT